MFDGKLMKNLFEYRLRHRLLSFVKQAVDFFAVLQLAHDAGKFQTRANFTQRKFRRGRHNRRADEFDVRFHIQPPLTGGISASSNASPTGRSQSAYSWFTATRMVLPGSNCGATRRRISRGFSSGLHSTDFSEK